MKKRAFNLFLILLMVVTVLPLEASAESTQVMTANEFINYLTIALNRETEYSNVYPENVGYYNGTHISWDCWNLGKTIIATRGAAVNNYTPGTYSACSDTSIGLYDTNGDGLESACGNTLNRDFSNIVPGEWLFKEDSSGYCYHVGYYIGNERVIESTSDGSHNVQISTINSNGYCGNITGRGSGWAWTFHGKVPWIKYDTVPSYLDKCTWTSCSDIIEITSNNAWFKALPCSNETAKKYGYTSVSVIESALPVGTTFRTSGLYKNSEGNYWYSATIIKGPNEGKSGYIYKGDTKVVYAPQSTLDNAEGGAGTVHVRGWSFDRDALDSPVPIHVYVGGPAGSGTEGYEIFANTLREDVNNAYPGVGNYHGFDSTIEVQSRGTQTLYVYACDLAGGPGNQLFATATVTISEPVTGSVMTVGAGRTIPDGDYIIACAADSNYILNIAGEELPAVNGANVSLYGPRNGEVPAYDVWTVKYIDDGGFYSICQKGTNMSLDVDGASITVGGNIQAYTYHGESCQQWSISRNEDGSYRIRAKCSGFSLDYYDGVLAAGTNVVQWFDTSYDNQKWTFIPCTYTVTYNANGGTGAPAAQTKTHGIDLTLSSTKPTRASSSAGSYTVTLNANGGSVSPASLSAARTISYTFKNWNTAANGSGTSYASGATYSTDANVTLYAQWNSSTTTAAVTLPTPTRSGYIFKGWGTSSSSSTGVTGSYTPTGNVTLYAVWEKKPIPEATSGTWGDLSWTLDGNGLLTISGSGDMDSFTANTTDAWLAYKNDIKSVVINNGVTSIGHGAFYICKNLEEVSIPSSVTSIGRMSFTGSGLTSLIIPEGVTNVEYWAFCDCKNLTSVTIPLSLTSIGHTAFALCSNLTDVFYEGTEEQWNEITIGDSNDPLLNATIHYHEKPSGTWGNLVWVLDDGVLTISGNGPMDGFNSDSTSAWRAYKDEITSVQIESGVTSIGGYAFTECAELTSVTLPEGLMWFEKIPFAWCDRLSSISIPVSVTNINDMTFLGCDAIIDVYYSGTQAQWNAVTIGEDNGSLLNATIHYSSNTSGTWGDLSWTLDGNGLLTISGNGAMADLDYKAPDAWLAHKDAIVSVEIKSGVTGIGSGAFYSCGALKSVTIPKGVTSIGKRACSSCTGLTSVTLPASLREIDSIAFYNCGSLTDVYYGGTQQQWNAITIGSSNSNLLNATIHYSSNTSGTWGDLSWTLDGNGLLTISGSGAMADLDYKTPDAWLAHKDAIVSVEIKSGVTGIGSGAFYSCGALKSVTIPNGVTSIGSSAFGRCAALESVTIPEGVTSIGHDAFYECRGLKSIRIPGSVTEIDYSAFQYCTSLTEIELPSGITSIGNNTFMRCESLESLTIPEGVTSIGKRACSSCTGLTSVTLPASLREIDSIAFYNCGSLTDVYYGGTQQQWNAITIGSSNSNLLNATIHCSDGIVRYFILPEALTTIEAEAFAGGAFSYVKLPEGATTIGSRAFADCPSLRYIYIPEATTGIAADAFSGVSGLTILGKSGSYAEFYAQRNGYAFSPAA